MCYTQKQIEHIVRYYGMEIKRRVQAITRLIADTNLELPEPPAHLRSHTIRICKNTTKLEFIMAREPSALQTELRIWRCYERDGKRYTDAGGLKMSGVYADLSSATSQMETVVRMLASRPTSIDSFIWYCDHAIEWLDRTYESLKRHIEHLKYQREQSKNHTRVMAKLADAESQLIAASLADS